jgi:hypothetical protein
MRRSLADTLVDVIDSMALQPAGSPLRVTRVDFDLPLEIELRGTARAPLFCADLPRWRWTTDFDVRPSRMRFSVAEGAT